MIVSDKNYNSTKITGTSKTCFVYCTDISMDTLRIWIGGDGEGLSESIMSDTKNNRNKLCACSQQTDLQAFDPMLIYSCYV